MARPHADDDDDVSPTRVDQAPEHLPVQDANSPSTSTATQDKSNPANGIQPPAVMVRNASETLTIRPKEDSAPPTDDRPHPSDDLLAAPDGSSNQKENGGKSPAGEGAEDETIESPTRRSVQFRRSEHPEQSGHTRHSSLDGFESPGKGKGGTFMSMIKAMAGSTGLQSPRSPSMPPDESRLQPAAESAAASRSGSRTLEPMVDGVYDADADAELTADEANIPDSETPKKKKKKRQRMRRHGKDARAEPPTPSRSTHGVDAPNMSKRLMRRRASMPDTSARDLGMSDDELVRQRDRPSLWRRGAPWMDSGSRPATDVEDHENTYAVARRRGHQRRSTALAGGAISDGEALAPKRPIFGSERASTYGIHKWNQVKKTLRVLRQRKAERVDYYKSAELMAELRAGAPAVLMLASMIQRDEHGNKRIPVLLEQLRVRAVDSYPEADEEETNSNRHWYFVFELEYGSGPSRMNWTITRSLGDLYNLHFRYKFTSKNDKYMPGRLDRGSRYKQPKFPYSAFPYMREARNKNDKGDSSEEDDRANISGDDMAVQVQAEDTIPEEGGRLAASDVEGPHAHRRKRSRINAMGMRRRSTGITDPGDASNTEGQSNMDPVARKKRYIDKQRRVLEKYISGMIRWLMFRAESNRLCRFLELSALGVRLAAEGSYHGKEGFLHIQSSKGLDFRRVLTPGKVIDRHTSKWFLVRQSYLVCVESPENMNIYDVYLVDSKFSIISKRSPPKQIGASEKQSTFDLTKEHPREKHHTLTLATSERQVRLFSRNQSILREFEASINEMLRQTPWYQEKRFNSFAPVRNNVFAQWLVDGRDYMWNVSRAINMAKDVIYIHDWWLSPELYMRRPACISQKWRLDRLLQKKAREGVKIFVIIYRNVEAAIPIDSEYTKFSLLNLHPNIFVQRSPNQFKKNQFFFAHHEKICIVDHDVAFVGGIDLCFGRWDCPQHPITDDKPTGFETTNVPKDADHCQLYPGKDYSNPRVQDFYKLHEPYAEMYDRSKVPRMPWHDISMQVVGQPARDLTRHFVQRWNYLRRGRKPTRPLPFLLPAPDANMDELEELGLTGTCEVQILRSASTWSLGIEDTEHSIQTAYIKMIEDSEHFVYMENQFFITSTEAYNVRIMNRIGDALVERIIRAHENDEDWRCVIIIPLMPGFQNTVDQQDGTSVRLILMCQYCSISRGENSIFARLRAAGIEPDDYISFYSLRQWGIMANDALVTEQLYIHAKAIIVDDRVALIGSANINERSMLGSRDSECAAIVRDTDMLWSTMAGKPYQVGRFAYTLRMRLMREHLGLDVDEILEQERQEEMDGGSFEDEMNQIYQETGGEDAAASTAAGPSSSSPGGHSPVQRPHSFNAGLDVEDVRASVDLDVPSTAKGKEPMLDRRAEDEKHQDDVTGYGPDHWKDAEKTGCDQGRDSVIVSGDEVLVHGIDARGKGSLDAPKPGHHQRGPPIPEGRSVDAAEANNAVSEDIPPMPSSGRRTTEQLGLPRVAQPPTLPVADDDTDIGGLPAHTDPSTGRPVNSTVHPMAADIKLVHIDKDCMADPISNSFLDEVWDRAATNNTMLYRRVFRCMPDSTVATWDDYRDFAAYQDRFQAKMDGRANGDEWDTKSEGQQTTTEKPHIVVPNGGNKEELNEKLQGDGEKQQQPQSSTPRLTLDTSGATDQRPTSRTTQEGLSPSYSPGGVPFPTLESPGASGGAKRERRTTFSNLPKPSAKDMARQPSNSADAPRRGRRGTTRSSRREFTIDDMPSRAEAEELLNMTQGHLVQFPHDWLLASDIKGNWSYQVDSVAPLAI
ncbi:phospholipase D1/2 [Geosmithia morbida]|uniref:Phospholipase n=1 Tax=Geosmithia morbida TaxID=1094350 RepID=A0A9P5D448_9HYPO|nr:phospholipase D1/2 [Geosmithia morbida]KAF4125672.1 phospholipase D1/2 [Geosmithia morbida]